MKCGTRLAWRVPSSVDDIDVSHMHILTYAVGGSTFTCICKYTHIPYTCRHHSCRCRPFIHLRGEVNWSSTPPIHIAKDRMKTFCTAREERERGIGWLVSRSYPATDHWNWCLTQGRTTEKKNLRTTKTTYETHEFRFWSNQHTCLFVLRADIDEWDEGREKETVQEDVDTHTHREGFRFFSPSFSSLPNSSVNVLAVIVSHSLDKGEKDFSPDENMRRCTSFEKGVYN